MLGMLSGDKKKAATMIVANILKGKEEKFKDESPVDDSAGLKAAMTSFLSATKSGDVGEMVASLKDFIELCQHEAERKEETKVKSEVY